MWAYATAGTLVTVTSGSTVAVKGETNTNDYLYSEMPVFLYGGTSLTLTNGTDRKSVV